MAALTPIPLGPRKRDQSPPAIASGVGFNVAFEEIWADSAEGPPGAGLSAPSPVSDGGLHDEMTAMLDSIIATMSKRLILIRLT
ncbi:MAG: hypothetical protein RIC55_05650 [Pirellulaceae bacterium]